jgi:hypothetical protein
MLWNDSIRSNSEECFCFPYHHFICFLFVLEIVSDFDFGFRSFPSSVCVCQLAGADGHFEIIMRLDVSADSIWRILVIIYWI